MSDLRYPIGTFERPTTITATRRGTWIDDIASAPAALKNAVAGLGPPPLDTPYRPGEGRLVPLDEALGSYAWHGRHHVAHITALRQRSGW